jgi:hypothetical protein
MRVFLQFFALVALMSVSSQAFACRGPDSHSQTYLKQLPANAFSQELVALVRIESTRIDLEKRVRVSSVSVIEPIKNTTDNQSFEVISEIHSCAQDGAVQEQNIYFIAGSLDKNGIFHGIWYGDPLFTGAMRPEK